MFVSTGSGPSIIMNPCLRSGILLFLCWMSDRPPPTSPRIQRNINCVSVWSAVQYTWHYHHHHHHHLLPLFAEDTGGLSCGDLWTRWVSVPLLGGCVPNPRTLPFSAEIMAGNTRLQAQHQNYGTSPNAVEIGMFGGFDVTYGIMSTYRHMERLEKKKNKEKTFSEFRFSAVFGAPLKRSTLQSFLAVRFYTLLFSRLLLSKLNWN